MKKLPKRTLRLNIEIIRDLATDKLSDVVGGDYGSGSGVSTCHTGGASKNGHACAV